MRFSLQAVFSTATAVAFGANLAYAQTPPAEPSQTPFQPPQQMQGFQPGQTGGQLPPMDPRFPQPGQFPNDPNSRGPQGQGTDAGRMEQERERQRKEQDVRTLNHMRQGSKQMERQVTMLESRIKSLKTKGAVIPADVQTAIDQMKTRIEKMKSASTSEDLEALMEDGGDLGDLMQTLNEGMQKAEMSTQIPRMVKEATRMLKQQQSALARAQTRAKGLKISVESILTGWQKSIETITQAIAEAQQTSQSDPESAMDIMKDRVFDAFQDLGDWQQTFGIVSNVQQGLKQAEREMVKIDQQIARLKKQKENTAELEELVAEGRAKISTIKDILAQSNVDSEALILAVEEAQDIKQEIYVILSDLTGQQFGQQPQQIPGLQFKPIEPPKGLGQFFRDSNKEKFKETCRVDALGADMPGNCGEVQSIFENRPMPGNQTPRPSSQGPGPSIMTGPQSLKNAMDELSPSLRASIVEAFRKYMASQLLKK